MVWSRVHLVEMHWIYAYPYRAVFLFGSDHSRHPFHGISFRGNYAQFSLVNIQWAPLAHLITCEKQQAVYQALNSHTCGSCTVCTRGPNCIRPIAMLSCDTSSGLTLWSTTWNLSWPFSQTNNVVHSALIVCPLYAMRFTFSCELRAQWCVAVGQV